MKWPRRKDDQQPKLSIEQQRAEKLAELGAQLWASRQEQGLSLEEVVALTRIPRRLLQAIEEGNLDDLPEPIYIQGLIRQFADALGFKGTEFASSFPITGVRVNSPLTLETKPISQLRPIHLYLLYIFVIVCSVTSLSQMLNNSGLQANDGRTKPRQVTESFEKPLSANYLQQPTAAKPTQAGQPVKIGVTVEESSWIRVIADGKTQFEGTLPQGSRRTWQAQEQLTVKTNNAGGVLMSVNQEQAKPMGELGKAEEIKIAAKPRF
ncbi:helix-turn-helix domain-containing protein [Fortiea contorta]|uniref:helix-turn-helix domain-containing protein n=1 Tax=Fortiea contorta TaxID=1892405 RepID=UPI000346661A|nr:RodZ domain-containing protein [Fortiea contorta]